MIYEAVGRDLRAEVEMVRLDPQYRLVFGGGGELLATPNITEMECSLAGHGSIPRWLRVMEVTAWNVL